jgi:hypothetical protein
VFQLLEDGGGEGLARDGGDCAKGVGAVELELLLRGEGVELGEGGGGDGVRGIVVVLVEGVFVEDPGVAIVD